MTGQATMINEQRLAGRGSGPEKLRAAHAKTRIAGARPTAPGTSPLLTRASNRPPASGALFRELDQLPTEGWPGPEPLLEIRENPRMMHSVLAELRTVAPQTPPPAQRCHRRSSG